MIASGAERRSGTDGSKCAACEELQQGEPDQLNRASPNNAEWVIAPPGRAYVIRSAARLCVKDS